MNTTTITNATNPSNAVIREDRFASSAAIGMLVIVTAAMILTAVAGSGSAAQTIGTLVILALPASLFALSLAKQRLRLAAKIAASEHVASAAQTKSAAEKSDNYFPSWLGSSAYSAACAGESD
jgi:hypothetical protein